MANQINIKGLVENCNETFPKNQEIFTPVLSSRFL